MEGHPPLHHTEIHKHSSIQLKLPWVTSQNGQTSFHQVRGPRGRDSCARRYYDRKFTCCGQIYLLNIYYFIHSLNGNGLIGSTGTTAAVLVYSFCWQPHQIEQRGKRKWTKSNFKEEQDFCVLMLAWPSWTLQCKASHKTTDRALLL